MPINGEPIIEDQALAFLGTIMASLSHELNNTIAIIKEYNGLLDDHLLDAQKGSSIDDKKVERVSKKIASQTEKSTEIIKRFNKFAHSLDNPVSNIGLNDMLQSIIALARRLTEIKGIYLKLNTVDESLSLKTNPLLFQQAIFLCFELFMANADANSQLIISAGKAEDNIYIKITGKRIGDNKLIESKLLTLETVLAHLNGSFEEKSDSDDSQSIVLSLKDLGTGRT
jgi:C4-dicarboxylate-specific signal transduction histidine kinase